MENKELDVFLNDFCSIDGIQALVLGGSRTTERADEKSDYDFYVYSENGIDQEIRQKILSKYCKCIKDIRNHK